MNMDSNGRSDTRSLFENDGRPRLFFGPDDLPALREKVKRGTPGRVFAEILKRCERYTDAGSDDYIDPSKSVPELLEGFGGGQMNKTGDALHCLAFAYALSEEEPDIVLTQWPIDTHRDHQVVALLAYDAWLQMDKSFALYFYEVMSGEQSQHFWPTLYVDIESVATRKEQANLVHKSQKPATDYWPQHQQMQRARGAEAGVKLAEAFIRHNQVSEGLL